MEGLISMLKVKPLLEAVESFYYFFVSRTITCSLVHGWQNKTEAFQRQDLVKSHLLKLIIYSYINSTNIIKHILGAQVYVRF